MKEEEVFRAGCLRFAMLGRTPAALLLILCACLAHDAQAGQLKQQIRALRLAATRGALRTAASRGPSAAAPDCTKLTADNKNVYWSSDVLKKGSSLSSMARDMYLCDEWKSNDGTRCALASVCTARAAVFISSVSTL